MLGTRNLGLTNLVLLVGTAWFVSNCSGDAGHSQSNGEGGASTEIGSTRAGATGNGNARSIAGATLVDTAYAGEGIVHASGAGMGNFGPGGAGAGNVIGGIAGSGSGDTGVAGKANATGGGGGGAGMDIGANSGAGMGMIAGANAGVGIVVGGSAGMGVGMAGSAGSPAIVVAIANPLHVAVGAILAEANGSEDHPFPSIIDAVVAIRATEASSLPWDGQIIVHEGRYEIPTTVELPPNADIKFLAGVTMAMAAQVSLHANRDVKMLGTEDKPVVFTWLEQDQPWASFTLFVPTSQFNEFAWVTFEHGGEATYQGISVRGALALEGAGAHISNCTFQDNTGDDGLSLGSSPTKVEHSAFLRNAGDGIDIDGPATQEISHCVFDGNGNDGLDIGEGADTWAHDNMMLNSVDTGIEIGEASHPTLDHNLCLGNSMGIGIKDDADPLVSNCTIFGNQYGIVGYHFKSAFGSGKGTVTNTIVSGSVIADVALVTDATTKFSHSCIPSGTYSTTVTVGAVSGKPKKGVTLPLTGEGLIGAGTGCDDPLFVNASGGDFHLMSSGGHWNAAEQRWVVDATSSPCIDSGDPQAAVGAETSPNGGRIDMGIYGGRAEASHSP